MGTVYKIHCGSIGGAGYRAAEKLHCDDGIHCGSVGGAGPAPRQNTISAGNSITAVGANQGRQSRAARFARSRRGPIPAAGRAWYTNGPSNGLPTGNQGVRQMTA